MNKVSLSDKQLLEQACRGDDDSIKILLDRFDANIPEDSLNKLRTMWRSLPYMNTKAAKRIALGF